MSKYNGKYGKLSAKSHRSEAVSIIVKNIGRSQWNKMKKSDKLLLIQAQLAIEEEKQIQQNKKIKKERREIKTIESYFKDFFNKPMYVGQHRKRMD